MKEFKGTPGPWIYAANSAFFDVGKDHRLEEPGTVMAVYPSVCIGVPFDQEDDARLIAAAPELLEALLVARDYVTADIEHRKQAFAGYPHNWTTEEQDLAAIDAAIAKALGEDHE